jgi:hypothetical protein
MKKESRSLEVPAYLFDNLAAALRDKEKHSTKATLFKEIVEFGYGIDMDIKVCGGGMESEDGPWTEAVLFDNGHEVDCSEVFDRLDRTFRLFHNDTEYSVKVSRGKD